MDTLKVGDKAPDFELMRKDGRFFRLYEALKEQNVVLYFYPRDNTSGCTKQACEFRDQYDLFQELDTEIVGISSNSLESHKKFERVNHLPFVLLSDNDGNLRNLYGVPRKFGILPGRVTFVIDRKGIVRYIHNSFNNPTEHVNYALEVLKALNEKEEEVHA